MKLFLTTPLMCVYNIGWVKKSSFDSATQSNFVTEIYNSLRKLIEL